MKYIGNYLKVSTIDQSASEATDIITLTTSRSYLEELEKYLRMAALTTNKGDIMMIWKSWIQRSVLCGLVLGGLVAFATTASAADSMPAITDHAGLATWYEKEATTNRQKAKDMEVMKAAYTESPAYVQGKAGLGAKTDIPRHCDLLISSYTKVAEGADQLAKVHHAMMK